MKGSQIDALQAGPCQVHNASRCSASILGLLRGNCPYPGLGAVRVSVLAAGQLDSSRAAGLGRHLPVWLPELKRLPCMAGTPKTGLSPISGRCPTPSTGQCGPSPSWQPSSPVRWGWQAVRCCNTHQSEMRMQRWTACPKCRHIRLWHACRKASLASSLAETALCT